MIRFGTSLVYPFMTPKEALAAYAEKVAPLAGAQTTREETYYPEIRTLVQRLLGDLGLPADVRQNTSERREGGRRDVPDLALYDGGGDFVTVCFEVKRPVADIGDLAMSEDQNDQVGRYLARTGVVVLCTVREFALLTRDPAFTEDGPVPPKYRRLETPVEIWPSAKAMTNGDAPAAVSDALADVLERAATQFAPIAAPQTLARVLARQARRAKNSLPSGFTKAVEQLADDFGNALGVTFKEADGEEFFRSSLIQTVYYGLFAGWTLSHVQRQSDDTPFRWQDIGEYLRLPFLNELFHEILHPKRLADLQLREWLDLAAETLGRVDEARFFAALKMPVLAPVDEEGESNDSPEDGAAGDEAEEAPRRVFGDVSRDVASAVVYFYEPFLETFDPDLRKELGVWYTPPDVVRYQVHRTDALLREMGVEQGLANEDVVVLDPACGTGAYLIETLACIADTLRADGVEDELGATLLRAVERRVIGFEILTAPFVVAHLQIHLLLAALGAEPEADHRPGVYLTNSLTGWSGDDQVKLNFPELQEEHDAARAVKRQEKIIVVIGNPPYNRFAGVPMEEEKNILDAYQGIERDAKGRQKGPTGLYSKFGVRKQVLEDLYVRFFRIAEQQVGIEAPYGVVSFITNSSFLRGRSHPLMRKSLLGHFDEVWVDNLNGDKYRTGKRIPEWAPVTGAGGSDESIFSTPLDGRGIQPGAAITTWVKRPEHDAEDLAAVHYRDFWGDADAKRAALLRSLEPMEADDVDAVAGTPAGPRQYEDLGAPLRERTYKLLPYEGTGGFEDWYGIDELFDRNEQGVNPNRGLQERSLIDTDRAALAERMKAYFSTDVSFEAFAPISPGLTKTWARYDPQAVRAALQKHSAFDEGAIEDYVVFPLDARHVYYERAYYREHPDEKAVKLMNERRSFLGDNLEGNEFLVTVPEARQPSEGLPLLATSLFDHHIHDRSPYGFPAEVDRVIPAVKGDLLQEAQPEQVVREANLFPEVWAHAAETFGLEDDLDGTDAKAFARRLFRVILALMHAPSYQEDHRDALSQGFARVPIPEDAALFERAVALGDQIATLLNPLISADKVVKQTLGQEAFAGLAKLKRRGKGAIKASDLVVTISHFGGSTGGWRPKTDAAVGAPGERDGDLYIGDDIYFENVPETVWDVRIGGYPVVKKWLGYRDTKRRDGAPLTLAEKDHLRSIVRRLAALLVLRGEANALYAEAIEAPWTPPEVVEPPEPLP